MEINFKVVSIDLSVFNRFFSMSNDELRKNNAMWLNVDSNPGYPCRVSLQDAELGERVLAVSYEHNKTDSPYLSSGPIFVREKAREVSFKVNEIPKMLRHRDLSLRGYSSSGMMLEAICTGGEVVETHIKNIFKNNQVKYIYIHNAKPGCFNCSVERV